MSLTCIHVSEQRDANSHQVILLYASLPGNSLTLSRRTLLIKDPKERIPHVLNMLYPEAYLEAKNDEDPTLTNREVQTKVP